MSHGKKGEARRQLGALETVKKEIPSTLKGLGHEFTEICLLSGIGAADAVYGSLTIITKSDAQRDRIRADERVFSFIRERLRQLGYTDRTLPGIVMECESQQTVDRDWGGSWHNYFK